MLAEENGQYDPSSNYENEYESGVGDISTTSKLSIRTSLLPSSPNASFASMGGGSPSPSRRSMMVIGGTGRVLSDLQAGVEHGEFFF